MADKRNIYMVQPNSQYGNSVYFPYAAGCLVAFAFENETIKNEYSFCSFVYKHEDIDSVVERMQNPFFVGFSCYLWNYEYNKKLAFEIKRKWPECFIAFGGHQCNEESDIYSTDFVDFITLGEGESAFEKLLLYLIGKCNADDVPNLYYRNNNGFIKSKSEEKQIPHRVSPYLKGYFDELIPNESLAFSAILETNRGCPNKCAFCDWGNIKCRVRLYDMEMVRKEIDWFSEHKIEYVYAADANFGLFPRDEEIISYLIQKHKENGFPMKFQATYSKNNPDVVFNITKRLNEAGMSKGATLSFQSMSEDVLNKIGRENMPLSHFKELMSRYNSEGISAYSEIIIGLPGESYESFRDGIETLIECGQHTSINFFNCELLRNSGLNDPDYKAEYKIVSARTEQHQYHVIPKPGVKEYSDIVVSTSTMSVEDWIKCNILSVFVRAFHNMGLLQCFAIYLFYECGVKYTDFYESLISFSKNHKECICGRIYGFLLNKYTEVADSKGSLTCNIPDFGKLIWPLEEGTFLLIIREFDKFYTEIKEFLSGYIKDSSVFDDLLSYQLSIIKTPYKNYSEAVFSHDWPEYFRNIIDGSYSELTGGTYKCAFNSSEVHSDLAEYAVETVWYGRRGGKITISDIKYLN